MGFVQSWLSRRDPSSRGQLNEAMALLEQESQPNLPGVGDQAA